MVSQPEKKRDLKSVLFVCTANICRSPMAAALFREQLKKIRSDWDQWRIQSAGTWASDGESASRRSIQVMAQRGLDIRGHTSRIVTESMLDGFDLILTMEPGHKEALQVEFPTIADRVYMLSEMEGSKDPIEDPYGGPLEAYQKAAAKIETVLQRGMPRILELVEEQHATQDEGAGG